MKRILLTGCCGFIGSHLTERLLNEKFEVWGVDNFDPFYDKVLKQNNLKSLNRHHGFKFIEADLSQEDFFETLGTSEFDAVFHLAAKVGVQPSLNYSADYINGNILATTNLLNYMLKAQIDKLVFASSSSVYGNDAIIPFTERDSAMMPISPYAATKRACELLNYTYHHLYKISVINLRLFTVYGPRQRPDLVIHKFVKKIDQKHAITVLGDGKSSRDYTFISDVVEGFLLSLYYLNKHPNTYEIINIGSSTPVNLTTLIDHIAARLDTKPKIVFEQQKAGDVDMTHADISKAKLLLGYQPKIEISKGIEEFIFWYRNKGNNGT